MCPKTALFLGLGAPRESKNASMSFGVLSVPDSGSPADVSEEESFVA